MKRLLAILLLVVLFGCQQSGPLDLESLTGKARGGDPEAMRQLVSLLAVPRDNLNGRVYALLLEIGQPAAPFLREQITAENNDLREHAIAALGNLQDKQASEAIGQMLTGTHLGRRYIAAWALGEIGSPGAVPYLIQSLADSDQEVRKAATRSLIKFNRQALLPLIADLPVSHGEAQAAAIRALGDIGLPEAVAPLLQIVNGENRREVVLALGKLKDPRAEEALIAALADSDWQVRMNAAMALGPVGSKRSVAPLQTTLEDEVMVVREWSARSLAMMTGKQVMFRDGTGKMVPPYNVYH